MEAQISRETEMIDNTNFSPAGSTNAATSPSAGNQTNVPGQSNFISFIDQLAKLVAADLEKDQNASAAAGAAGTPAAGTVTTPLGTTQGAALAAVTPPSATSDLQLLKTLETMLLADLQGAEGHKHHHHHHHVAAAASLDLTPPADPTDPATTDPANQTTTIV
jgi:hypothetical protein